MTRRGTERLIYLSPSPLENEGGERLEERALEVGGQVVRRPWEAPQWQWIEREDRFQRCWVSLTQQRDCTYGLLGNHSVVCFRDRLVSKF